MDVPDRYLLFVEYFNQGRFMSAQMALDEVWLKEEGPDRDFYGGLIQLAVSLYHLTQGNADTGRKIFERTRPSLVSYGEKHLGLSVGKLLASLNSLFDEAACDPEKDLAPLVPKAEIEDAVIITR